jgi:hypothetical protein
LDWNEATSTPLWDPTVARSASIWANVVLP